MISPLDKEARVREKLEAEFGMPFSKKKLSLKNKKSDGSIIIHEFDLVSEDGKIVGEVKAYKYTEKAQSNTRRPRAMVDCRYLELVKADKKLLILTDREFHGKFTNDSDGLAPR